MKRNRRNAVIAAAKLFSAHKKPEFDAFAAYAATV
jgi:hypothetical protein